MRTCIRIFTYIINIKTVHAYMIRYTNMSYIDYAHASSTWVLEVVRRKMLRTGSSWHPTWFGSSFVSLKEPERLDDTD